MKELEKRIIEDGKVLPGEVLKVDNFINHQIDPILMMKMANEYKRLYEGTEVTKILTIEASGIAISTAVGYVFNAPVLFAKKSKTSNISDNLYSTLIHSYTHGNTNTVVVSKDYLNENDKVLIIDDFLATGAALNGLIDLCNQAGATVAGVGIVVEKEFQGGGNELRNKGYRVESLAKIKSMDDNSIEFCD